MNDLWQWNPSDQLWTWLSGSDKANPMSVYGMKKRIDGVSIPGGRMLHQTVIHPITGVLMLFGGLGGDGAPKLSMFFW